MVGETCVAPSGNGYCQRRCCLRSRRKVGRSAVVIKRKKAPAEMTRRSLFALFSARIVAGLMPMIIRDLRISVNWQFARCVQCQGKPRFVRFAGSAGIVRQHFQHWSSQSHCCLEDECGLPKRKRVDGLGSFRHNLRKDSDVPIGRAKALAAVSRAGRFFCVEFADEQSDGVGN